MDLDDKTQRALEQTDDLIRNQVETRRNCFWQNNMTLHEGPHSEESCLPVPANEIAEVTTAAERNKRVEKLSVSLKSIVEDQGENDSCTSMDSDSDPAAANDAVDNEVNTSTVPYPSELDALAQTATLTEPVNEPETREEIRSIIKERFGPIMWRACYFDTQARSTLSNG